MRARTLTLNGSGPLDIRGKRQGSYDMKPCIFIHTNEKQIIGALVSKYSFERFASKKNAFDVKLIDTREFSAFFKGYEGKQYLRDGLHREWLNEDLQSFTVLRFAPPQLMNYEGR